MEDLREKIEELPKGVAIAFGLRCARLAFSFYTGESPETLEEIIATLESGTEAENLPSTTKINGLLKKAKANYTLTKAEEDAANAYVAFSVYSALRSVLGHNPHISIFRGMTSARKALRHLDSVSEEDILEDLEQCSQRSSKENGYPHKGKKS